jgi:hypothetical protein
MSSAAPPLLSHCSAVYAAMEEKAEQDGDNLIYTGALTRLVTEVGFSNPYYTSITTALKGMDCIRQSRRGGGGIGSVWLLLQKPTEELFMAWKDQKDKLIAKSKGMDPSELERLIRIQAEKLTELGMRIDVLEAKVS